MSDRAIADLCPKMQILAREFLAQCNNDSIFKQRQETVFIDQTYRCEADQNADYAKGRTEPGSIITNARYGQSPHNCVNADGTPGARAFDIALQNASGTLDWDSTDPAWQRAIAIGESLGLISGSTFHSLKDNPHFELPAWQTASAST